MLDVQLKQPSPLQLVITLMNWDMIYRQSWFRSLLRSSEILRNLRQVPIESSMYNHPLKARVLHWMKILFKLQPMDLRLWHWICGQIKSDRNPEYGRWSSWVLQNKRPVRWQDIPAVPVTLFRDLSLTCFPAMLARHRFRTSGTAYLRGQHALLDTEVYDNGSIWGRDALIGTVPTRSLSCI